MEQFLELFDINLDSPKGYLKVFITTCICGFIIAFLKDVFMFWLKSAPSIRRGVLILYVRLAVHVAKGCKSLVRPSSGKDTAKTKGVVGDCESERRWRQISGLTNRNHIRLWLRIRLHNKLKSNNYSELTVVNVADIWRESDVWYQGRSCQRIETEYEVRE